MSSSAKHNLFTDQFCLALQNRICSQDVLFARIGESLLMCISCSWWDWNHFQNLLFAIREKEKHSILAFANIDEKNKVVARKETISGDSLTPIEEVGDHG